MEQEALDPRAALRLKQVLKIYPVSEGTWRRGVREGRYPRPIKIAARAVAWRAADILALLEDRESEGG
jgi:predicted DNA-binding transcriptional regulator AlpA